MPYHTEPASDAKTQRKLEIKKVKMTADSSKGFESVPDPLVQNGNWFMILISPPGGGKTTLVKNLLTRKTLYGRRFDTCHYFSPSLSTVEIPLPKSRLHNELNVSEIEQLIKNTEKGEHMLLVLDDMVASLPGSNSEKLKPFLKLVFNRRHLCGPGGGVSIILTAQKLSSIPRALRCASNMIVSFYTSNLKELKTFWEEYSHVSWEDFLNMCAQAWSEKHSFLFGRLDRREGDRRWFKNFTHHLVKQDAS